MPANQSSLVILHGIGLYVSVVQSIAIMNISRSGNDLGQPTDLAVVATIVFSIKELLTSRSPQDILSMHACMHNIRIASGH